MATVAYVDACVAKAMQLRNRRLGATVIALMFGWCGGHWFYLGRPARGVFNMIFMLTLIPAIVAFVRALTWLGMTNGEFEDWMKKN